MRTKLPPVPRFSTSCLCPPPFHSTDLGSAYTSQSQAQVKLNPCFHSPYSPHPYLLGE